MFWFRLLIGLTILGIIVSRIDLGSATVRPSAPLLAAVVGATGIWILSQAVAALRWRLVLGAGKLSWSYLLRLYLIGAFFGLFLPTSVGGDAVRALAAARSSERAGRAIATVLIDRAFGVLAVLAYAGLGVALIPDSLAMLRAGGMHWHAPGLPAAVLVFLMTGIALLVIGRNDRVRALWGDGIAALKDLVRSPSRLVGVVALAGVSQGLIILLWYMLAWGMNFGITASSFLWMVPVVSLSALLPITFAGLGIREGVWLVLLAGSAIPSADIVTFSLLYFLCNVLVGIIGAILFVSSGLTVEANDRTRD